MPGSEAHPEPFLDEYDEHVVRQFDSVEHVNDVRLWKAYESVGVDDAKIQKGRARRLNRLADTGELERLTGDDARDAEGSDERAHNHS